MTAPFRLRVHGRSGHASMPGIADNALVKAAPLIEALGAYRPEPAIGPEVAALPRRRARRAAAGGGGAGAAARARPARGGAGRAAALVHALADDGRGLGAAERDSRHGARSRSTAACCPARRPRTSSRSCASVLGAGDYELEMDRALGRHALAARHAALGGDRRLGRRGRAGCAKLAPICCAGFTDCHWLRDAFGTVAYGFFPLQTMEAEVAARLIHSADERDAGRRPRARRRLPAPRRALAG